MQFKTYSPLAILERLLGEVGGLTEARHGEAEANRHGGDAKLQPARLAGSSDEGVPMEFEETGLHRSRKTLSVLVVDDEPLILDLLEAYFEEWPVAVQQATSCVEALNCLREQRYDLVISDYFLKEGDGVGLFSSARLIDPGYGERFLFMSGSQNDARVKRLTKRHCLPCLAKPFTFSELRAAVDSILSRSHGANAEGSGGLLPIEAAIERGQAANG